MHVVSHAQLPSGKWLRTSDAWATQSVNLEAPAATPDVGGEAYGTPHFWRVVSCCVGVWSLAWSLAACFVCISSACFGVRLPVRIVSLR